MVPVAVIRQLLIGLKEIKARGVYFEGQHLQTLNEPAGFLLLRMLKDLFWRSVLIKPAFIHIEDTVADGPGEIHFMGDDQHGFAGLRQIFDDSLHFAYHGGVQGAGRFIQQDDIGIHREGAGNGYALLLTAGESIRITVGAVCHADLFQQTQAFIVGFLGGFAQQFHGGIHGVFDNRQVAEEVKRLENHAHFLPNFPQIASGGRDLGIIDPDPAGRRL